MAATRVAAVARVHRNFYSDAATEVSCIGFIRRLCADLSNILGKHIDAHGDDGNVPTTLIQPIGLLVNELVTNAAKHSVEKIDVAYSIRGNTHELHVGDDGEGLPAGFDPDQSVTGLGMRVVTTLTKQLGGRVTACPNPTGRGARFIIAFPA